MRTRRADANQPAIVEAFRKLGASVAHCHTVGKGFPDIAVGYGGLTMLVEIKDPNQPPSKQKLTDDEQTFFDTWKGGVRLVTNPRQVHETVEVLQQWVNAIQRGKIDAV